MPPPWSLWNERRCCVLTCGCRAEYERTKSGSVYCDEHKPVYLAPDDRVKLADPVLIAYDWHKSPQRKRR